MATLATVFRILKPVTIALGQSVNSLLIEMARGVADISDNAPGKMDRTSEADPAILVRNLEPNLHLNVHLARGATLRRNTTERS